MYRFLSPLFLLCFAGPLWACSCGGTISYAPIVASPVVTFEKTSDVPEQTERQIVKKPVVPAIPQSAYPQSANPNSVAEKPVKKTLTRLQTFDLPMLETTEQFSETQTVAKPPVDGGVTKQPDETKPEVTYPPELKSRENESESITVLAQSSSRRGEEGLRDKPESPEGPSGVSLPNELTQESSETPELVADSTETSGFRKDRSRESRNQENSAVSVSVLETGHGGAGGSIEAQSWTITTLVLLAAISTVAFLCMVLVVGEYRRRWLNAIMSQNGMTPGFQGGLYDMPGISMGYRRYED
ncbi:MAG: hypothetical protein FWC43_08725 [Planctomycetaceae bacterium]|nr:hypothetical protein [Planctomycetaceae bacterium]